MSDSEREREADRSPADSAPVGSVPLRTDQGGPTDPGGGTTAGGGEGGPGNALGASGGVGGRRRTRRKDASDPDARGDRSRS